MRWLNVLCTRHLARSGCSSYVVPRLAGVALAVGLTVPLMLLPGAPAALAHDASPASTTTVLAGPYTLTVALYADPPRPGQELPVLVTPTGDGPAPESARLLARPGLGVDSIPTRATLVPDPDAPGSFAGAVRVPVMGAWLVDVLVDGPSGPGAATLAVTAAAPGALPIWLGWALGLSPLLGVAWFGWWQHRYLGRLEGVGGPTPQPRRT
jgi:hypothetical protein